MTFVLYLWYFISPYYHFFYFLESLCMYALPSQEAWVLVMLMHYLDVLLTWDSCARFAVNPKFSGLRLLQCQVNILTFWHYLYSDFFLKFSLQRKKSFIILLAALEFSLLKTTKVNTDNLICLKRYSLYILTVNKLLP